MSIRSELCEAALQRKLRVAAHCDPENVRWPIETQLLQAHSSFMGKTKRHQQAIYLDHEKATLLDKLSQETRVPKQEYLREAVDLLLTKYKKLKHSKD